jgi:hypothetical protein
LDMMFLIVSAGSRPSVRSAGLSGCVLMKIMVGRPWICVVVVVVVVVVCVCVCVCVEGIGECKCVGWRQHWCAARPVLGQDAGAGGAGDMHTAAAGTQ